MLAVASKKSKRRIENYARILYENYRARIMKTQRILPVWNEASPFVKREFMQEAEQLLR